MTLGHLGEAYKIALGPLAWGFFIEPCHFDEPHARPIPL